MPRGAQPALQLSHVREDQTQQRILHCLQELAEVNEEPMIVVSQLQFGDYLRNPCYAAAASMLPRPFDLRKEEKHRGDFDLLVIHKHHGLLAAEIKTVGDNFASLSGLTEQRQDDLVAKKVQQAVKQLNKSGTGKTLVLVVRALDWLHRGWEVHVISTWSGSMAASYLIVHQLQQSAGHRARQHVHLHVFDFKEKDKAIATIPAPLTYSDVFLLTVYKDHFHDEERDTDDKQFPF
nr:hypothetical protein BaRGS_016265 [Batillaria attramentaria]